MRGPHQRIQMRLVFEMACWETLMADEEAPRASAYLQYLWGVDGSGLGKPPPAPPPLPVQPIRPHRQCVSHTGQPKSRHRSPGAAGYAMKLIKQRPGYAETPDRPLSVYECPLCHYWHIGRTPPQRPQQ